MGKRQAGCSNLYLLLAWQLFPSCRRGSGSRTCLGVCKWKGQLRLGLVASVKTAPVSRLEVMQELIADSRQAPVRVKSRFQAMGEQYLGLEWTIYSKNSSEVPGLGGPWDGCPRLWSRGGLGVAPDLQLRGLQGKWSWETRSPWKTRRLG